MSTGLLQDTKSGSGNFRGWSFCNPDYCACANTTSNLDNVLVRFHCLYLRFVVLTDFSRRWRNLLFFPGIDPVYELCSGQTTIMAEILHPTSDNDEIILKLHRFLLVALVLWMNISELAMYLNIWRNASIRDEDLFKTGVLSADKIAGRNRKNAITLTGQAVSFATQLAFMVIFLLIIRTGWAPFERSTFPILVPIQSSLISLVMFLASPELRKHYLSWNKLGCD